MLNDASSSAPLRLFVDQLAATGHELAIIGFGAKGWCGMCFEQLRNATFKTWLKGEVAYAKAKGVGLSACEYLRIRTHAPLLQPAHKCEFESQFSQTR